MTISEFLSAFEAVAPSDKAAGWDPVGLQLGNPAEAAVSVAVCHEVTETVVARVEATGIDLLVTYHPLLFHPTNRLVAGRSPAGRAFRLIRARTALAVAHTNFDVAPGGVADALADALDLTDTTVFGPLEGSETVKIVTFVPEGSVDLVAAAMSAAGGGVIGNYSHCSFRIGGTGTFLPGAGAAPVTGTGGELNYEPEVRLEMVAPAVHHDAAVRALVTSHPYEEPAFDVYPVRSNLGLVGRVGVPRRPSTVGELAGLAATRLGRNGLRVTGDHARPIGRVAVVPGTGSGFLTAAASAGADVIVTGDVPHHRCVEAADRGLAVVDPGHLATERPGVARLYAAVAGIVPGAIDWTDLDPGEDTR